MLSEIEALKEYYMNREQYTSVADMLLSISHYHSDLLLEMIDLSLLKEKIDTLIHIVGIYKRYHKLRTLFNDRLAYGDGFFVIEGNNFASLDEVEKAWNNKAFL